MKKLEQKMVKAAFYGPDRDDILRQIGFVDGAKWASAEWQKIVEPLVDAIKKYVENANYDWSLGTLDVYHKQAKEALANYKKEIE